MRTDAITLVFFLVLVANLAAQSDRVIGGVIVRELSAGSKLEVITQESFFAPDSFEAKKAGGAKPLPEADPAGNVKQPSPPVVGSRRLIALLQKAGNPGWKPIWTNEIPLIADAEPGMFRLVPLDALEFRGKLYIAFRQASQICVEQIGTFSGAAGGIRHYLVTDLSRNFVWTNAVFETREGNRPRFRVSGSEAGTLVWELCGEEWRLDLDESRPEAVRDFALREWAIATNDHRGWVIFRTGVPRKVGK